MLFSEVFDIEEDRLVKIIEELKEKYDESSSLDFQDFIRLHNSSGALEELRLLRSLIEMAKDTN